MYKIPPEVVKTWPSPNYDNPETRGSGLLILVLVFFCTATFVVSVRCYTRWYITNSFGVDDVYIMVAMIPTTGLAASVLVGNIRFDCDRHVWDMRPETFKPCIQVALASAILFTIASVLTKLSLYAFYLRLLAPKGSRVYKRVIWFLTGICVLCGLVYILISLFLCRPIQAFWDYEPPLYRPPYDYHCVDRFVVNFGGSIANTILDFVTMLAPAPIAWRLALPIRQRLAVIAIFGLGTAVCIAGALRTKYVFDSEKYSYDEQWDGYPLWILLTVEIDVGIICASAPALRPFIARHLPKVFGSSNGWSSYTIKKSPGPGRRQPRSVILPHGSPGIGFPSDISRDEQINDDDQYVSLSSSPKSAPKTNIHSRSSSLESGPLPSRQRVENLWKSRKDNGDTDRKHGMPLASIPRGSTKKSSSISMPSGLSSNNSSQQTSSSTDAFHGTTTITTVTAGAPPKRDAPSNSSFPRTVRTPIDDELEHRGRVVIRGFDRNLESPDLDIEQGGGSGSWRTDDEGGYEDGSAPLRPYGNWR